MYAHLFEVFLLLDFVVGDGALNLGPDSLILVVLCLSQLLLFIDFISNFPHFFLEILCKLGPLLTLHFKHNLVVEIQLVVLVEDALAEELKGRPLLDVSLDRLFDLLDPLLRGLRLHLS